MGLLSAFEIQIHLSFVFGGFCISKEQFNPIILRWFLLYGCCITSDIGSRFVQSSSHQECWNSMLIQDCNDCSFTTLTSGKPVLHQWNLTCRVVIFHQRSLGKCTSLFPLVKWISLKDIHNNWLKSCISTKLGTEIRWTTLSSISCKLNGLSVSFSLKGRPLPGI